VLARVARALQYRSGMNTATNTETVKFTPHTFTEQDNRDLAAFAHAQAHAARMAGDEVSAQKWEAEAFKVAPAETFRGPWLISHEVLATDPDALPIRLSVPVLCF
jgi:hypothetical protein